MDRKEMIQLLIGEKLIEGAEWFGENDPETIEWVMGSQYCDFEEEETVIEIQFDEGGDRLYACSESADCKYPSQNQPPWCEDSWKNWSDDQIELYYRKVFGDNLIDVLTVSEASQEFNVDRSNLTKAFRNGWKGFREGVDCRKSGDNWIVNRESMERAYGGSDE